MVIIAEIKLELKIFEKIIKKGQWNKYIGYDINAICSIIFGSLQFLFVSSSIVLNEKIKAAESKDIIRNPYLYVNSLLKFML